MSNLRTHRKTFLKAFEEEMKCWRWASMTSDKEALILAFCACIHLRMKGSSMDKVMYPNRDTQKGKADVLSATGRSAEPETNHVQTPGEMELIAVLRKAAG